MLLHINQKRNNMNRSVMTCLTIILLTGSCKAGNVLFPGPIYGGTGQQVEFSTSFTQPPGKFQTIVWSFGALNIITSTNSIPDVIGPQYNNRVNLNKTTGALILKDLKMNDYGVYTVILTPADGTQTLHGRTVLQVFDPVTGVTITGPNFTLVEDKTSANLTCDGKGSIITTEWLKNGQHLSESGSIIFSADNRSVLINPVSRSDSGEYVCILTNPFSSEMGNYSISVLYGPDVKILGAEVLEEGSDVLLYCLVSSEPPASLTWIVNDLNVGNSSLYISENSSSSHSGLYTCTASNHITGLKTSAQHTLTVRGASNIVLSPGEIAGIVVGLVLAVLLGISLFFNFRKLKGCTRKVKEQIQQDNKINQPTPMSTGHRVGGNHIKVTNFKQPNPTTDDIYEEFDEPTYAN